MNILGKDRDPLDTIKISSNFFLENGALLTERWSSNSLGLYSVNLQISGTGFSSNGKGISKEAALASAHGELQERLLNRAFFRLNSDVYYMNERESHCRREDVERSLQWIFPIFQKDKKFRERFFETLGDEGVPCDVFLSREGEKIVIPARMVDVLYGSNGMCAGNSVEEAMVQGLSEILERYVARIVFVGKEQFPSFNYKKLEKGTYFDFLINRLKDFEISVLVKDLSLGLGIPAVGVVFYNLKRMCFFFKIGVHPNLNIALERCFTEFFQGKTDEDILKMVDYIESFERSENDLFKFFVDGCAPVPMSLLSESDSGSLECMSFSSNNDCLKFLYDLIEKLSFHVYVLNNSNELFNAYRIVVPGMSEITPVEQLNERLFLCERKLLFYKIFEKKKICLKDIDIMKDVILSDDNMFEEVYTKYHYINVRRKGKTISSFKCYELINLEYLRINEIKKSFSFLKSLKSQIKDNLLYLCLLSLEFYVLEYNVQKNDYDKLSDYTRIVFPASVLNQAFELLNSPNESYSIAFDWNSNFFLRNRLRLFKLIGGDCND